MKYNYSAMKQKFDNEQKKLAAQYHAAGMSEEAIKEMHEFDLKAFRLQRNDIIHKAEIEEMTSYDRVTGEAHYKDMDEFPAAEYQRHYEGLSPLWIEQIEDRSLSEAIQAMPQDYIDIISKLIEGHSHKSIAAMRGVTADSINKKIARIRKKLKLFL